MRTLAAASLAITVAACSPTPHGSDTPAPTTPRTAPATHVPAATARHRPARARAPTHAGPVLTRYHWQLASAINKTGQRIDALFARPDAPLQLDFAAGALAVSNTCNRMHASYATANGKLTLGALASTMMACNDRALEALDRTVSRDLRGTIDYATDSSEASPQLVLTTAAGDKLVFNGVPTARTRFGSEGATGFLEIAPAMKPCMHPPMPSAQCLEVRQLHYDANGLRVGAPGAWHVLAQPIEGYHHRPGARDVLRVKRYAIAHPSADGASTAYVLDMVVESGVPPHKH